MYPHVYEQALDRLACAVGGKAVLPAAFQHIPGMLASHDWKLRYAGLMAIASVAEGTSKVI
jgi:importin-5